MRFEWATPELFDALIIVVVLIGGALAIVRLYADFTRPLPRGRPPSPPPGAQNTAAMDDQATEDQANIKR